MVKKFTSTILIAVLLTLSIMVGGGGCGGKTVSGPEEKNPFNFDYKIDQTNVDFFVKGDTVNTLIADTPFYTGAQPLPGQRTSEFDTARANKVKEIKQEADTLFQTVDKMKPQLANLRTAYLSYLTISSKEEPKLAGFTKETFDKVAFLMSKEQIVESQYKSISSDNIANSNAKSLADYIKVAKAVELGGLYLQDIDNISVYAALAINATEGHSNQKIKEASEKLDGDMEALDDLKSDVEAVMSSMSKIDYGFKQLDTCDYYLALEATEFITSSLPDLKAKVGILAPKGRLTAEDIKFTKAYLSYFEKVNDTLKQSLNSVDKTKLIPIDQQQESSVPFAYAAGKNTGQNYANAYRAVAQAPRTAAPAAEDGYLAKGWSGVKTVVRGAKTVVGVGLDTLGAAAANISQIGIGIYRGQPAEQIWEGMEQNSKEIIENYKLGISGASTLKTAGEYLEGAETGIGQAAEGAVDKTIGQGWTSWAVGGVTKATVGMFTGLGRGIYQVANTDATTGEIAEGTANIVLSFVGGSKVIIKGSQVPGLLRGLSQEGRLVGAQGLNIINTLGNNAEKKVVLQQIGSILANNKFTKQEMLAMVSNSLELEAKEATARSLSAMRAQLTAQMTQILKEGGEAALQSSRQEFTDNLADLLKKSFARNMQGYLEAIKTVVGESSKDYFDNLIGGWVDGFLSGLIKDVLAGPPEAPEMVGTWNGAMVVMYVPAKPMKTSGSGKNEGCDMNIDFSKIKGKSIPLKWQVMRDGTFMWVGDKGKGKKLPYTFRNSNFYVKYTEQGSTLTLLGKAERGEKQFTMKGKWDVSAKDKAGKVLKVGGTWSASKPKPGD